MRLTERSEIEPKAEVAQRSSAKTWMKEKPVGVIPGKSRKHKTETRVFARNIHDERQFPIHGEDLTAVIALCIHTA